jgi:hypothetical protein
MTDFPEAHRAPLAAAQAAFRQSPGRATALAYMDAAIETWETTRGGNNEFVKRMQEIRNWLMNEKP